MTIFNETLGAPERKTSLGRWLIFSLLLHCLLVFLINRVQFRASPHQATVIFKEPPKALPPAVSRLTEELPLMVHLDKSQHLGAGTGLGRAVAPQAPPSPGDQHQEPGPTTKNLPEKTATQELEATPLSAPTFVAQEVVEAKNDEAPSASEKNNKGFTMASLAAGYLNYMKHERTDETVNLSKPDMKYVSYCNSIAHYLSMSCAAFHGPLILDRDLHAYAELRIEIDKSGIITSCSLSPSTGIDKVDQTFLGIIKNAAPLPPIPAHFNRDHFAFKTTFMIALKQGNNNALAMSWHGS